MFCYKCGKQIEDGSRFCQYCGALQDNGSVSDTYEPSGDHQSPFLESLSALDIGIFIVYAILIIRWTIVFLKGIKYSWNSFSYLGSDAKFIGMILYIVPYAFLLCLMVIGVQSVRKRQYYFSTGIITVILGLVMKIGTLFFNEVSYKSYQIIASRIFNVYGEIGISTILLGVIVSIFLYTKMNHQR